MNAVTILTDFGWRDPWVGEVKGVLLSQWARWPRDERGIPPIVDLGHEIPVGDIAAASWFLDRVWRRFPTGTIHLAVVDPGVGSSRPAVAAEQDGHFFVGPGNGLFSFLGENPGNPPVVVRLDNKLYQAQDRISATFHGRDIFAPAAAHLAMGVPLAQVGSPCGPELLGSLPITESSSFRIRWIDRFGNAVTDLPRESTAGRFLEGGGTVTVAGKEVAGPLANYSQAAGDEVFWYWGSGQTLELACRGSSAAERLGLKPGLALAPVGL